jgi:hypothetical protein
LSAAARQSPLPSRLVANAWSGSPVSGAPGKKTIGWTLGRVEGEERRLPTRVEFNRWNSPDVGWGLILPEAPVSSLFSLDAFRTPRGAPEPIRRLVKERNNAPVFRYLGASADRPFAVLRRESTGKTIQIDGVPSGTGAEALPYYLLIYGTPEDVPWRLQYVLNQVRCVGRLALKDQALENYVDHLLVEWKGAAARFDAPLAWSVDHLRETGREDITTLMRASVAQRVFEQLAQEAETKTSAMFIDGSKQEASGKTLLDALKNTRPGLVITTSHGLTSPLNDPAALKQSLGLLLDEEKHALTAAEVLDAWDPDGAIWYAHACCSAGSDSQSAFEGLFEPGGELEKIFSAVAGVGSTVAPLPQALLGAKKPLRAFIGHVEPTFDYSLRNPKLEGGAFRTLPLVTALYQNLYLRDPVAWGFRGWYGTIGSLNTWKRLAQEAFDRGEEVQGDLLYYHLAALDVESLVILGDPTVALPRAG